MHSPDAIDREAPRSVAADVAAGLARAGLPWIVPAWPAPPAVGALSTTRGAPPLDATTTAAPADGDDLARFRASDDGLVPVRAILPSPPVWLRQVHGTAVAVLDRAGIAAMRLAPPVADAAVTRERGVVCAVRTADCLPVLFADRRGRAVGAAHAGWRGLAAGVLEATIGALEGLGATRGELVAWLGPAIGPSAFEVGADVIDAFVAADPASAAAFVAQREGKWHADLYALARRRLAAAGVTGVHGGGWCTLTDATRFHSYRRGRDTARMATLVWLGAPGAD